MPFWQLFRPVRKIGKLRKTIILSAFSADIGETNMGLFFNGQDDVAYYRKIYSPTSPSFLNSFCNSFSIMFWVKPENLNGDSHLIFVHPEGNTTNSNYSLRIRAEGSNGRQLGVEIKNASTSLELENEDAFSLGVWVHVAVVYDGSNLIVYLNGQEANSGTLAGPLKNSAEVGGEILAGMEPNGGDDFNGYMDDLYIVVGQTFSAAVIAQYYNKWITKYTVLGVTMLSPDLNFDVLKFNTGEGDLFYSSIDDASTDINALEWSEDGAYPWRMGAENAGGKFSISVGLPHSLKYPIAKPDNANFVAVIAVITAVGVVRYRLWELDGVDIDESMNASLYRGELLPTSYDIEVWGPDGQDTVDMTDDLVLETSILQTVSSQTEEAEVLQTATLNTSIYAATDGNVMEFPLVFNSAHDYNA